MDSDQQPLVSTRDRVLDILEWPQVLAGLAARCVTDPGRALAECLAPLQTEGARQRLRAVSHLKELLLRKESPDLSGVTDITRSLQLADKDGVLTIDDLIHIRDLCRTSRAVRSFLQARREEFPSLAALWNGLAPLLEITTVLEESLTETGELSPARFPELRRLGEAIADARDEIQRRLTRFVNTPAMSSVLQERIVTTRNDRFVVLVKAGMKQRVPGTVHDISASGATYYIEPETIIALNSRAVMLEKELAAEIYRILARLSRDVGDHAGPLGGNLDVLARLDLLCAAARFSIETGASEPAITDRPVIDLKAARHPLLVLMKPTGGVVANDIVLGDGPTCLVISGANTGGKTVILKTVGLAVIMASCGLHVAADPDSSVGLFTTVMADIGDDQNLSQSLSTFSGQIVAIREMLEHAGERTLILVDEIVVGTNPRQGAALAQAILEELAGTGARVIVTTHYTELKDLPAVDQRFRNASVSFDLDTLRPTYRLMKDLPGVSYALEIARNYGLPPRVIDRSRSLLDGRELTMEALLESIQRHEQEMAERATALDQREGTVAERESQATRRETSLASRAADLKKGGGLEFLDHLAAYKSAVAQRTADLQQSSLREIGEMQQDLKALERMVRQDLRRDAAASPGDRYQVLAPGEAVPGLRVFIHSLEREGTIESVDLEKGIAQVFLGGAFTSSVSLADCHRAPDRGKQTQRDKKKEAPAPAAPTGNDGIPVTIQTSYNTIDLRGKRVDDGLRVMEGDLDRMMRDSIDAAVVIHGHGTGAMKQAVRDNLRYSVYVADFRPGELTEGGDGVTIVRIRH